MLILQLQISITISIGQRNGIENAISGYYIFLTLVAYSNRIFEVEDIGDSTATHQVSAVLHAIVIEDKELDKTKIAQAGKRCHKLILEEKKNEKFP